MAHFDFDVIILGAGAAGLAAAAALSAGGARLLVLEARERIGGRIDTRIDPALGHPIELGAEFIHGEAPSTFALLAAAGAVAVDATGRRFGGGDAPAVRRVAASDPMQRLLQRALALSQDLSVEEFLDRQADDPELVALAPSVRRMVEGFDAADPQRASIRAIAAEWSGSALQGQYRPLAGYAPLLAHLARAFDHTRTRLMLGSVAEGLAWDAGGVRICARSAAGPFEAHARRALLTLPVSLLQPGASGPGALRIEPALTAKHRALEQLALGPVIKVILQFRSAFWESLHGGAYAEAGFLHAPEAPFPTLWTALPFRVPLLTAWMGGPRAARYAGASREQLVDAAMASVQQALQIEPLPGDELVAAHIHDWGSDTYARGAYTYVLAGGAAAPAELAQPLQATLYFAGEATSSAHAGTVEAALQSGQRAARQVLAAMTA